MGFDAERAIARWPLAGGGTIPALGLGTWRLGESAARRKVEVEVLRQAIVLGYRLFDTAEMYGEGGAESVVGEALAGAIAAGEVRREELFIVSKVYPHNASRKGTAAACERSRKRLGLERIDLYLLHWRGEHPLAETVAAMQDLVDAGRIGHWGVSNFDTADMRELADAVGTSGGGAPCASNQVYYSLSTRGPEFSLLPWMREQRMPLMAYSPIDQGALLRDSALRTVGARHGASAAQAALAWILHQEGVVAIPKAANPVHLAENLRAATLALEAQDLAQLDRSHPAPRQKTQLSML